MLAIRPQLRPLVTPPTRFSIGVCHRRAGKTVAAVQRSLLKALTCTLPNPRTVYIAPTYGQAKRAAWDYVKLMAQPVLAEPPHETELRVTLLNGARVQLFGADNADTLRGQYFDDVVLDEYADMPPSVWPLVVRPALSDRKGSALFIGTPKGRNTFFELWEKAESEPDWSRLILRASESGLLDAEELDAASRELTPEQYAQEYEGSFDAAIIGSYFGKEIADAERAGRIGSVPLDPALPVNTSWDLGVGDSTAIWFWQVAPNGIRVIDYYENSGQGLPHYVAELLSRGYRYGEDWVPHDARARELGTGRTRVETLLELKRRPRLVPDHRVMDGINAARVSFPRIWIDAEKCRYGLEALRQYRSEYDEKKKVFKDTPRHDWTSHAADAFRYMAMAWRELQPQPKPHDVMADLMKPKTAADVFGRIGDFDDDD